MTKVLTFKPRQMEVRAMRIILGKTTRTQILEFCPIANVGVVMKDGADVETDIRWLVVGDSEMSLDGDWLVQLPSGGYTIEHDHHFHLQFEAAE